MSKSGLEFTEMHWLMDVLQNIDIGLVILDRDYKIQLWNGFMENHSGLRPDQVHDKPLFDSFSNIPADWFKQKAEPVFELKTRTFTIWEQRPYLFKFKNYRPITGRAEHMYQNTSIIPLESIDGSVKHICVIIYDVTDIAVKQQDLAKVNSSVAISLDTPSEDTPSEDTPSEDTLSENTDSTDDVTNLASTTDALTKLMTTDQWQKNLAEECNHSSGSLILIEIDQPEDTDVDQQDDIISKLALLLRRASRQLDIVGRLQHNHFAIFLVDAQAKTAVNFAERVRSKFAETAINGDLFTVSAGVAELKQGNNDHLGLYSNAEKALRHAQGNGKNKTTLYQT